MGIDLRFRSWWLNSVAANPIWSPPTRGRLMRLAGIDVHGTLWHGSTIMGTKLTIERGVTVNVGVTFGAGAGIVLETGSGIGQNAILMSVGHEIGPASQRYGALEFGPITVERGAWIGAGTIVHPGVTIGAGCVVASGSVVTRDLEPNGLYAGAPATRRRDLT